MEILNLPKLAFECVVENMVLAIGLYKAVRLRLICSKFSQCCKPLHVDTSPEAFNEEVLHAVFATDIFDFSEHNRILFLNPKCSKLRLVANVLKLHQRGLIYCTIKQAKTLLLGHTEDRDSKPQRLTYDHDLCDAVAHNIGPRLLFKRPNAGLGDASFDPGQDLLSAAAAVGDHAKVARLLSENPNPHIKSKFFGYASVNAVRRGQKDMLALILTHDGTGHIAQELRESVVAAFCEACRAGQQEIFEYLLDLCSRVEWLEADWLQKHGRDAFNVAASHGYTNILKQLLHEFPTIRAQDDLSQSLRTASGNGHMDAVQFLLSIGADFGEKPYSGNPLHSASRSGHAHIVRLLLEQGANYHAVSRGDPLYWASRNGHMDVVQILLDHGANINAEGPDWSVLARAAMNGETPMVRFLLQKGVDVKEYGNGDLALKCAAQSGHVDIVKLLAELGVDVNGSGDGNPPILRAMIYGQHHMVKTLLEMGAGEVDPLKSKYSEEFENGKYPLSGQM